jgi:methionyl-tRNA formyltransferase
VTTTAPLRVYLCGQQDFGRRTLQLLLAMPGIEVVGVSAPEVSRASGRIDRLWDLAHEHALPCLAAGQLRAELLPARTDLIIAAHSHDYLGRLTRARATLGAIGYHPSLLPRHRGRDAVRWTLKMRDPIAGGTVFWLGDAIDAGDIAAQDWCWVLPDDTPATLWRQRLAPMGLRLFARVLADLQARQIIREPQEEAVATWEPSWGREPLFRPELPLLGDGGPGRLAGWTVRRGEGGWRGPVP